MILIGPNPLVLDGMCCLLCCHREKSRSDPPRGLPSAERVAQAVLLVATSRSGPLAVPARLIAHPTLLRAP